MVQGSPNKMKMIQQIKEYSPPSSVTFELRQIESFKRGYFILELMEQEKLQEELDAFKKHLVLNFSLREITIHGHLGNIKRMIQQIQTTNPEKEEVTNYVYELRNSGKSVSHQCNNINSIEKYMDFKKKLVRYAKPKRIRSLIKDILTEAEVSRMLWGTKNIREKAMLSLLAYSGIRNRSFCNLKVRDIDLGENTLIVRKAKGNKEYITNISSDCVKILLKYLEEHPRKNDDYLFTSIKKNNQYTTSDLRKLVQTIASRIGINKQVYPHLLRHSLASNMLNRGANIVLIKEQLGHDWIQSTETYLSSFPSRIKSEFEVYKPAYL